MNVFQMECFLAVAENLNFARAAEQLHVTQPAVTQQIHALERELNVKLFTRTTRTVKLTEQGRTFINDAQQMVAISERAKKRFETFSDDEIQLLSLGCYNYPFLFPMSDILRDLREEYPYLHPRLQVIPFQHIYRLLDEGDLDAVVGFKEADTLKISAQYKEVRKVPLVCICPSDHTLSERKSITPEELKNEKLVLFSPVRATINIARLQGDFIGNRAPAELYFCDSAEAITVLVSAGFGVSVVPDLFLPDNTGISRIPVEGLEPVSFGVYYKSLQGKPLLKAFIRKMREMRDSFTK